MYVLSLVFPCVSPCLLCFSVSFLFTDDVAYVKRFKAIFSLLYWFYDYLPVLVLEASKRFQRGSQWPQALTKASDLRWLSHEKVSAFSNDQPEASEHQNSSSQSPQQPQVLFISCSFQYKDLHILANFDFDAACSIWASKRNKQIQVHVSHWARTQELL